MFQQMKCIHCSMNKQEIKRIFTFQRHDETTAFAGRWDKVSLLFNKPRSKGQSTLLEERKRKRSVWTDTWSKDTFPNSREYKCLLSPYNSMSNFFYICFFYCANTFKEKFNLPILHPANSNLIQVTEYCGVQVDIFKTLYKTKDRLIQ